MEWVRQAILPDRAMPLIVVVAIRVDDGSACRSVITNHKAARIKSGLKDCTFIGVAAAELFILLFVVVE